MQYYRLWIYSCNSVLGLTSAIFTVFAAFVLADVRLSLLGGVELYHPTFLYAYAALILQCGVVQTIGCLGAQRLSHKLLSVYWILLLLLTIGDVVVGLVWVYKLDKVKLSLQKEVLTKEFKQKYSIDASFTYSWNKVQAEEHCCGVDGPADYNKSNSSIGGSNGGLGQILVPSSCCSSIQFLPPELLVDTSASKNSYNHQNQNQNNQNQNQHYHKYRHNQQHHHHHLQQHQQHGQYNETNLTSTSSVNETSESDFSLPSHVVTVPILLLTRNNNSTSPVSLSTNVGNSNPIDPDSDIGTVPTSSAAFNTNLLNSHHNNNNIGVRHKARHSGRRKTHGSGGISLSSSSSSFSSENQTMTSDRDRGGGSVSGQGIGIVTAGGGGAGMSKVNSSPSPSTPEPVKGPSSSSRNVEALNIPSPWSCQSHVLLQSHSAGSGSADSRRRRHKNENEGEEAESSSNARLAQTLMLMNSPSEQNKSLSLSPSSSSSSSSSYSSTSSSLDPKRDGDVQNEYQQQFDSRLNNNNKKYRVYPVGCQIKLIEWVDHVSGIMFILGFCIIGFIKACFLVILRYEIREMIEKIQVLETETPTSPSRNCNFQMGLGGVGNKGEYSKIGMSGTNAITSNFSGVTIKSPQDGDGGRLSNFCRNGRSTTHSQETVNMTLLITTPKMSGYHSGRGSTCGLDPNYRGNGKQFRSHSQGSPFFDYSLGDYFAEVEREDDHNVLIRIPHTTNNPPVKTVKKDLSFSSCSSVAQPPNNRSGFHHQVSSENNSDICELLLASVDVENFAYEDEATGQGGTGEGGVNFKQGNKTTGNESSPIGTAPYRRNGNNNIKTSNSFTLALLGTAV